MEMIQNRVMKCTLGMDGEDGGSWRKSLKGDRGLENESVGRTRARMYAEDAALGTRSPTRWSGGLPTVVGVIYDGRAFQLSYRRGKRPQLH